MRVAVRTMSRPRGSVALAVLETVLTEAKLSTLSVKAFACATSLRELDSASDTDSASVPSSSWAEVDPDAGSASSLSLASLVGLSADGTKSTLPAAPFLRELMDRVARVLREADDGASPADLIDCVESATSVLGSSARGWSLLLTRDRVRDGG